MRFNTDETIAAVATPVGEGGIGIVRLSGKDALAIADAIFKPKNGVLPSKQKPYTSQYGWAVDRADGGERALDEVLLFVMRAPRSYTREHMAEISCHGGRVVIQKVLELCLKQGARAAEPGEFTKRAFLNGRMDLAQAEAVLDVIRARTDRAHRAAQSQLEGALSRWVCGVRDELADLLSHLEASIDFPDDRIEPLSGGEIAAQLEKLLGRVRDLTRRSRSGLLVSNGCRTVLVGRPNVGKSSLMNRLAGTERVIVSSEPGTTRDTVEAELQVDGLPVRLVDTAGLRSSDQAIERESIKRTESEIEKADLVLFVADGSSAPTAEDAAIWRRIGDKPKFLVINKTDLFSEPSRPDFAGIAGGQPLIHTSCLDGRGVEELEGKISSFIMLDAAETSDEIWISSVRHADLLSRSEGHVAQALESCRQGLSGEFTAADVRLAMGSLGEIVGEVVTDDILDRIFARFCIGK